MSVVALSMNQNFHTNASDLLRPELEGFASLHNVTESDAGVDSWFLMENPWPSLFIVSIYLYFVLKLGPQLMENREPVKMKSFMILYNSCLIVFSAWWVMKILTSYGILSYIFRSTCSSLTVDPRIVTEIDSMAWYYLISKYVELLDTVLFVLRKKQQQVSFLHVYHHTNMAVATWAYVKYVRGSLTIVIGFVNTAVHIMMYTYYLLSSLGPRYQKYLWWKRYMTRIQLAQFMFFIGYLTSLLWWSCEAPKKYTLFAIANTISFLLLFTQFYVRTYTKKLQ